MERKFLWKWKNSRQHANVTVCHRPGDKKHVCNDNGSKVLELVSKNRARANKIRGLRAYRTSEQSKSDKQKCKQESMFSNETQTIHRLYTDYTQTIPPMVGAFWNSRDTQSDSCRSPFGHNRLNFSQVT